MSRSTVGASGKDTSSFHADISRLNTSTSNEPPMSHSDSTMDESLNCSTKRAFILSRNEQRAVRRDAEELNVSDDEILSEMDPEPAIDEGEEFFNQDEFSKLQNLSPDDFKVALNFSINRAAEAGFAAASNSVATKEPTTSTSKSTPFNRYATVFKVADEISGDEIPRQEIPDCIWKLVQARIPLALPCITTPALQFIHSNPTSIKTTKSADGVSQSK